MDYVFDVSAMMINRGICKILNQDICSFEILFENTIVQRSKSHIVSDKGQVK